MPLWRRSRPPRAAGWLPPSQWVRWCRTCLWSLRQRADRSVRPNEIRLLGHDFFDRDIPVLHYSNFSLQPNMARKTSDLTFADKHSVDLHGDTRTDALNFEG